MSLLVLHYLCLVTLLSLNLASCTTTDNEEPKRTFPFRRAIDGTRGRKFFDPEEDGYQHHYGSSGRYDPDHQINDFSDIRNNVPGEPGVDYPSYTRLPETGFACEEDFRGYYADEAAGCQMFHVCDASFLVSSFLCPVGSIFSQKLLTCDWWSKVDCSQTRSYHATNSQSLVSEADDDEILRKAFEMASVRSAGERIPAETVSKQRDPSERQDRRYRVQQYGSSAATERSNDLQTGPDNYSEYPDYFGRVPSRFQSRSGPPSRQRYREDDFYSQDVGAAKEEQEEDEEEEDEEEENGKHRNESPIRVHTVGNDRRNDRGFRNEFQPSYAPTVPTVITTTRRFYSPTFPTTYRPSTERPIRRRFDLEFESSDHLYNARGLSDDTVKAATAPSVVSKLTTKSKDQPKIGLPILGNGAYEKRDEFESIQESESSHYQTTVTLPSVRIDTTKVEASTESAASKHRDDEGGEIISTFSIQTIDNENRDPNIFAYNREEDASPGNETNVEISSSFVERNSTGVSDPVAEYEREKIAVFLQPPPEAVNQFRITVLEEPSTPGTNRKFPKPEINKSDSGVEIVQSVELPAIRVAPPLTDNHEATRESRVIRIFVNHDNRSSSSSDVFSSRKPETAEKIASDDSVSLAIDNEGEHSETKIISKQLPEEQGEAVVETVIENENSTSDATTVSPTTVSSSNATGKNSELENPLSAGEINAAAATLEKVESSSVDSEEERPEISEKPDDIPINSTATVVSAERKESNSGDETSNPKIIASQEITDEHSSGSEKMINEKTAIVRENIDEQSNGSEEVLLKAKTIFENEKSGDYRKSQEILLTANMTVTEEKSNDNEDEEKTRDREETLNTKTTVTEKKSIEPLIGGDVILLDARTTTEPKEETIEDDKNSTVSEETSPNTRTTVSDERIMTFGSEEKLLNVTTTDPAAAKDIDSSHERRPSHGDALALVDGTFVDTMVEGSSPFEVTLTVNKDEEFDPNGEVIRKLIAQQEIGDSVGAADYRNFEIVRSNEPEVSKNEPDVTTHAADSRNGRGIDFERNIDEETLSNIRSSNFPSQGYYGSLAALINGPNVPRPFSLESSNNVAVRSWSDNEDAGPSTSAPFASGVFRNNLVPANSRDTAQTARQAIAASSFQESAEPSEKTSGPPRIELSNDEKILDQLRNKEKLMFELPQELRSLDFITGQPADFSQQANTRVDETSENPRIADRSNVKVSAKTFVETEFVPSISFSLNSDAEREKYMDAVMKGLFSDVRLTESPKNDTTDASVES